MVHRKRFLVMREVHGPDGVDPISAEQILIQSTVEECDNME